MDSIILQSSKTCEYIPVKRLKHRLRIESLSVVPDEAAAARAGRGQGVDPRPAPGRTHRRGDDFEGIGARTRMRSGIPKTTS